MTKNEPAQSEGVYLPGNDTHNLKLLWDQRAEIQRLREEREKLKLEAEGWAQEARTQRATVREAYQAITGATGEPGDWHGAEPIKALVKERNRLREVVKGIRHYAYDTLSGNAEGPTDVDWLKEGFREIHRRVTEALKGGE